MRDQIRRTTRARPCRSEVEAVEHAADTVTDTAEHVADAIADSLDAFAEALAERTDTLTEAGPDHHAHEHHRQHVHAEVAARVRGVRGTTVPVRSPLRSDHDLADVGLRAGTHPLGVERARGYVTDRKSTRLNSSHVAISYAVFC